ncbi:NADH dehydrogenase [ubiquinone] iron-sulfur protein 4, mitochondrial-like [Durio zibethinus]|uniref:NADH dehydrogenase [ubiquinone] iron-sulfur protein 4, mitochondrial n=1 Tax=Durio zibethinus TaxID=66656 RepID=A0A6P6AMB1_DURZI|nr:NADH dehydrogenase [ubiquinone] iron-sulfur protein 4, mitochondrial-like [Durio zibethinus]
MAGFVRRVGQNLVSAHHRAQVSWKRFCSSDALMELGVKPGEVGMVSGIPEQQLKGRVIIYSPARTASQQGSGKFGKRKINFLSTHKNIDVILMTSSSHFLQLESVRNVGEAGLEFDSEEAAKAFAEKYGWEYELNSRINKQLHQYPFSVLICGKV